MCSTHLSSASKRFKTADMKSQDWRGAMSGSRNAGRTILFSRATQSRSTDAFRPVTVRSSQRSIRSRFSGKRKGSSETAIATPRGRTGLLGDRSTKYDQLKKTSVPCHFARAMQRRQWRPRTHFGSPWLSCLRSFGACAKVRDCQSLSLNLRNIRARCPKKPEQLRSPLQNFRKTSRADQLGPRPW